jgi:DNA-binding GntR family transcriptional regulator
MSFDETLLPATPSLLPPLGRPTSQTDLVASSLREAILSGRLAADEVLVERRIAEQLGVSKTPVREALIRLSNSGLVTTSRNRGVRVRRMTRTDARHVYEQRILLEPWATAQAIRLGRIDFSAVEWLCGQAADHHFAEDWTSLALANRQFHRAVYSVCANPLVVATLDAMQDLTALATLNVLWEIRMTAGTEHEEHLEMVRLARAGAAEEAARLMHSHISHSLERIATGDAANQS